MVLNRIAKTGINCKEQDGVQLLFEQFAEEYKDNL